MQRSSTTLLALAVLVSCGPDPQPPGGVTIAQYRSGLVMSAAGGCDTSIAAGLSAQLVEELNCVTPSATTAQGDTLTVSSAYRTLGQQYLLYTWWRAGQCGIQVAAAPGSSNHQSGRAVDTPSYAFWRPALQAAGWTWLGSSDVVHFDHLSSPDVASTSVRAFQRLWNRNHATGQLVEDGAWGPNTEAAMGQSPVGGFPVHGCATTGKVSGTITVAGAGTPLEGATVSAAGQSAASGPSGTYELVLPPGAVTVTASKPGYVTASVQRTVQVGATVMASVALTPEGGGASLSGRVVQQASPGAGIAGALVLAGGKSATTDGTGAFLLPGLPAGTWPLLASAPGFEVFVGQVVLTSGVTTADLRLVASSGDGLPAVRVLSPAADQRFDVARQVLSGVALDDRGVVASVEVSLNGGPPLTVPVVAGAFEAALQLAPGGNTVTVAAVDGAGQRGATTWSGTFRAGFSGLVHRFDDRAAIVVDADLEVVDPDTRALLGRARSGADGRFELEATAAGTALVTVTRPGFTQRDVLATISTEARTTVDVGLTPGDFAELRFLEPAGPGPFEVEELTVAGVVTGFEVASVTVNGVVAKLAGSAFVAKVPLPEGRTTLLAIAEGSGGQTVRAEMTVVRPLAAVRGGCAAAPDGQALAALSLAAVLARRRRAPRLSGRRGERRRGSGP